MVQPEIVLELADRFLWGTTAETVVVLDRRDVTEDRGDVRHDREEAPATEVVEGQLGADALSLPADDHA